MPGKLTPNEETLRKRMGAFYKAQEHQQGGYDDWGEFTAHAVSEYKAEIDRLRRLLAQKNVPLPAWTDPVPV